MDRNQRILLSRLLNAARFSEAERMMENAFRKAEISEAERQRFIDWMVGSLWTSYRNERMNQRLVKENEVRQLGLRFPNGTVKKNYSHTFGIPVEGISNVRVEDCEALGLEFKDEGDGFYVLSGMPLKAGDFTLRLLYDTVEGEPSSVLELPIAFNPNPRDLWVNIPTDTAIQYYKPDSAQAYLKVEGGDRGDRRKDVVVASQRGRSHAREGRPRDDDFSIFHCDKSDWYILAVADGAGSARFSRKGSEIACNTVTEYCREMLADNPAFEEAIRVFAKDQADTGKRTIVTHMLIDIILRGAHKAHEAIRKTADANAGEGFKLKDFATTLMFAICKKYDFGWFVAGFWVGDGAMCIYDEKNGTAKLLGIPDEGEYSGQTRFLTMPEIFKYPEVVRRRLRMTIVPDFTALFLMSDGVSDPMFETEKNLNDFVKWKEFYDRLKTGFPDDGIGGVDLTDDNEVAASQLLGWLDFWSPGNHDDRTIAIMY